MTQYSQDNTQPTILSFNNNNLNIQNTIESGGFDVLSFKIPDGYYMDNLTLTTIDLLSGQQFDLTLRIYSGRGVLPQNINSPTNEILLNTSNQINTNILSTTLTDIDDYTLIFTNSSSSSPLLYEFNGTINQSNEQSFNLIKDTWNEINISIDAGNTMISDIFTKTITNGKGIVHVKTINNSAFYQIVDISNTLTNWSGNLLDENVNTDISYFIYNSSTDDIVMTLNETYLNNQIFDHLTNITINSIRISNLRYDVNILTI